MSAPLKKWDIVRVFRFDLARPHDKFCICLCPTRMWFFYINSEESKFKPRRQFGLPVDNFQVLCLPKKTSYIDTTNIVDDLPGKALAEALADANRRPEALLPSLRPTIIALAQAHGLFNEEQIAVIVE